MKSDWHRKNSGPGWAPTPSSLKGHTDPQAAIMKTTSLWICVFGKGRELSESWWVLICILRVVLGGYVAVREGTNRVIVQISSCFIVWIMTVKER